jgi:hypothetical protein
MSPSTVRLVIGTPCYGGQVTTVYATSLLRLQQACQLRGIGFGAMLLSGDALITRARQNLVANFLDDPGATHLLFIDADIGFAPEQVFRLLDFDSPMTAAAYPTKRLNLEKLSASDPRPELAALSYVVQVSKEQGSTVREGFVRVDYVGTGFLMIQRSALLTMIDSYPDLRYTLDYQENDPLQGSPWRCALFNCFIDESSGSYLSEDYSFCLRWTSMGGEIWVDGESQLDHVGSFTYSGHFRGTLQARLR